MSLVQGPRRYNHNHVGIPFWYIPPATGLAGCSDHEAKTLLPKDSYLHLKKTPSHKVSEMLKTNYLDFDDAKCNKMMKKIGGYRIAGEVAGIVLGLLGVGMVIFIADATTAIPEEKFTDRDAVVMTISGIFGVGVLICGVIMAVASELLAAILMSIRYTAKQGDA